MSNARITIGDIETKDFRVVAKGYDQEEVDEFLDLICDELERMEDEAAQLQRQLNMARAEARKEAAASGYVRPAQPEQPATDSLREILEIAQRVKSQTIAEAEAQASEILAMARAQADASVGSLSEDRDALRREVEELRAQARSLREKLGTVLREHQEMLDQLEEL